MHMKRQKTKVRSIKKKELPSVSENGGSMFGFRYSAAETIPWIILIVLSILLSALLYPNILTYPRVYHIGDIADHNIKATRDFLVENKELSEKKRAEAVKAVIPVYDFDPSASDIIERVKKAFAVARKYQKENQKKKQTDKVSKPNKTNNTNKITESLHDNVPSLKDSFFAILDIPVNDKAFATLMAEGFPKKAEQSIVRLLLSVMKRGIVNDRKTMMTYRNKGILLHDIHTGKEVKVNDLDRFYDLDTVKRFIIRQRPALEDNGLSYRLAKAVCEIAVSLVTPNVTFNQRETEVRKDKAYRSIKPFYFKVKKGEMLVREGERITHENLIKLNEQNRLIQRNSILGKAPIMAILISFMLCTMYALGMLNKKRPYTPLKDFLLFIFTLVIVFLYVIAGNFIVGEIAQGIDFFNPRALLFAIPVTSGAMIICIFLGIRIAAAFAIAISVLSSIVLGSKIEFFIYFFVISLIAAYYVKESTERSVFIKAGLKVGMFSIILALCVESLSGSSYNTIEASIAIISAFAGGVFAGIITTGIQPLIEMAFGYTTNIKLLELASLDSPLLQKLMVHAPGTYHHSVIVSNMVEATAKAVNANPLLAKVAAYYHDIGKIKKPLYFVENQRNGENKHDKLAPSMSALILISHVKDGVEMAEKERLGKEIIDIIQQHHGTSLISFFYNKAIELNAKKGEKAVPVKEEDFRYPGPKPQTKEAGLVMLADSVEAASRALPDPTPARIQGIVQKVINKIFFDGQLDECELTLKDLHKIANSFNQILGGIYHHRIEYPESDAKGTATGKNGNTDNIRKEKSGNRQRPGNKKNGEGIRRLGLS